LAEAKNVKAAGLYGNVEFIAENQRREGRPLGFLVGLHQQHYYFHEGSDSSDRARMDEVQRKVLMASATFSQLEIQRNFEAAPAPEPARASLLVDLLAVPESEYFDWEPKPLRGRLSRQAD
jgi:hypothetical protein